MLTKFGSIFIHFSEDLYVLKLFEVSLIAFENVEYSQKGNLELRNAKLHSD